MSNSTRNLRDSYRAAIARTFVARTILERAEIGTPLFAQAAEDLSCCMRAEMEAGRSFMAALDSRRSTGVSRRRGNRGALGPGSRPLLEGQEMLPGLVQLPANERPQTGTEAGNLGV